MSDDVGVTQATFADIDWLLAHELPHMTRDRVAAKVASREYFIASMANDRVGMLRFSHLWSAVPFIELIFVEAEWRMKGAGRALLGAVEDLARRSGEWLLMSSSQSDEPEAQAWHRQMGFRDVGSIRDLRPFQDVPEVIFAKSIGEQS